MCSRSEWICLWNGWNRSEHDIVVQIVAGIWEYFMEQITIHPRSWNEGRLVEQKPLRVHRRENLSILGFCEAPPWGSVRNFAETEQRNISWIALSHRHALAEFSCMQCLHIMWWNEETVCESESYNFNILHAPKSTKHVRCARIRSSFINEKYFLALTEIEGDVVGGCRDIVKLVSKLVADTIGYVSSAYLQRWSLATWLNEVLRATADPRMILAQMDVIWEMQSP